MRPRSARPRSIFIDDSATMREVIKIAFAARASTIVACADAAAALAQFPQNPPDAVINRRHHARPGRLLCLQRRSSSTPEYAQYRSF